MLGIVRIALVTALWTVSLVLMVVRTADYGNIAASSLSAWAVEVALVASVVTIWHLMIRERHRIKDIAELVAGECQRQLRSVD